MKKRILVLLLALCLMASLVPSSHAAGIYFVAFNDTVPMTLSTDVAPYFQNGILLVPHTVFNVNGSGITIAYDTQGRIATIYNRSKWMEFNLIDGIVTDENGNQDQVTCSMRSGAAFLPVAYCAAHFGLSVSLQVSKDNYQVLRLTNGAQIYDDAVFMQKAETIIEYRVKQHESQQESSVPSVKPTQPAKPTQPQKPTQPAKPQTPEEDKPSPQVYLALTGLSDVDASLLLLSQKGLPAVFFLTAEEILSAPETVRAIRAAGFEVGITADPQTEDPGDALREANAALDQVTHSKTFLALLTAAQADKVQEYCVVQRERAVSPSRVTQVQRSRYLILCTAGCRGAVSALESVDARFRRLRETTNF